MTNAYKILVIKRKLRRAVRRCGSVWEYTPDIEMNIKETYVGVDGIELSQDRAQ
jgi:hypothetical protein